MLQLGRTNPSLPAELVLSEDNLEILKVIGSVNYQESSNTIGEVNKIIGKIGGYIDQKWDNYSGWITDDENCFVFSISRLILTISLLMSIFSFKRFIFLVYSPFFIESKCRK